MVMKESIEEMFPVWSDEPDDPQLVRLVEDIHAGRYVKGFGKYGGMSRGREMRRRRRRKRREFHRKLSHQQRSRRK
ncbi:unnamed protein product, partial [Brassica rapa]